MKVETQTLSLLYREVTIERNRLRITTDAGQFSILMSDEGLTIKSTSEGLVVHPIASNCVTIKETP
jgi:hypothetical protein